MEGRGPVRGHEDASRAVGCPEPAPLERRSKPHGAPDERPRDFPVNIFQSEIAAPGDRARGIHDPAIARGGLRGVRTGATALMDIIAAMLNVFVVCFYDGFFAAWAD